MTAPEVDPFDEGVPRGRYNRPLIVPLKRGKPDLKATLDEYDRASTVAGALDDGDALTKWQTRHAVVGVATNPDLAQLAAALGSNLNTYSAEDKRNLDAVIERAHDRSGGNEKADYGTAVHSLTEPGNTGVAIPSTRSDDGVVDTMTADVASYVATLDEAGIEVVATEVFVVNDELKIAGTFDHTYRFTRDLVCKVNGVEVTIAAGSVLIGDKKTGSLHFDAHAIQLAIYARGKRYDYRTGERTALDVSPQWGVVAHVPREGAETTLYLIDLHDGYEGAKLAVAARAYRLGVRKRVSVAFAKAAAPDVVEPETVAEVINEAVRQIAEATATPVNLIDDPDCRSGDASSWPTTTDVFSAPADPALDPEAAALALLRDELGAVDAVLVAISTATDADTCRALWSANRAAWTDEHTAAVKARIAELAA